MTPAERDLDKLMEECELYLKLGQFRCPGPYSEDRHVGVRCGNLALVTDVGFSASAIAVALNAFPAGARARLELMKHTEPDVWVEVNGVMQPSDKYIEASRLVSECEALQQGEGA